MIGPTPMRNGSPITAYIAVGANIGDRRATIGRAFELLGGVDGITVVKRSELYENPAVGMGTAAPAFLNGAAELSTTLGSHALLRTLLDVERQLGRVRNGQKWEPRTIDLDLVLYGNQIISSHELVVPHPLMHERRFVLEPLAEIAPHVVHPALQMTIAGLLEEVMSGKRRVATSG